MAGTISVVGYGRYVGTGKVEQEFVLYRDRTDGSRTMVEVFLDKEPVLGLMLDLKGFFNEGRRTWVCSGHHTNARGRQ
jgi:hypothetical protein